MAYRHQLPIAVALSEDIEHRPGRKLPYKPRVCWTDPQTERRRSVARMHLTQESAQEWIDSLLTSAARGVNPASATGTLAEYGNAHTTLALRGLEPKTVDPYMNG
ncbi:hypothetical protein [Streptomyces sp. CA2R106]|uniref:hypothetical protein n=1 Tax=Streptomyces sp. CA2R106 TaxID=3120153 RepID=UPI003009E443